MMTKSLSIMFLIAAFAMAVTGCRPAYPKCKKDSHCAEAEYCVNGLCQQCRDNGDCPEGSECASGACRDIPNYCQNSNDCSGGQICRNNTCGPCLQHSDCENDNVCLDGLCTQAECRDTNECPAGLSCVNYKCQVDNSSVSALGDGDCELEPIYFEFDSHEIDGDMRRTLQNNYECLKKRTGRVTLEGHCDSAGTTEYNMALGERRARMVYKILSTYGVEKSDMRVISKGEEEATGGAGAGGSKDRRVDFK